MNIKMVLRIIGYILLVEAALMLPGMLISLVLHETLALRGFLISLGIIILTAGFLILITIRAKLGRFYAREGLVTTGLSWIIMSMLGCLPFYISGEIPSYVYFVFEMVSGFTTSGSSILSIVEAMS